MAWWYRWTGVSLSIILFALIVAAPPVSDAAATERDAPEPDSDHIVIQRDTGPARIFAQRDTPPTLDELGYETVPVPPGMDRDEFLEELRADPGIADAYPDVRVSAATSPDDPLYDEHQRGAYESIRVPEAWELSVGRNEVVVAVIDTGIDLDHPDLRDRLWVNENEQPGTGIDESDSGCVDDVHGCRFLTPDPLAMSQCGYDDSALAENGDVQDDHSGSHGTRVAGIVGAAGDNGKGVTGVGWDIRIMPIKVLDCTDKGQLSDVARGIEYARRMGADIINLSLAAPQDSGGANHSQVRQAIAAAEAEDIIVVAAAGNYGNTADPRVGYPAAYTQYSNLVAVGSSVWDEGHRWHRESSYGPEVDIAAPGTGVYSTARSDTNPQFPYGSANGTSFAAPMVSGVFALMLSSNSELDHQDYLDMVRDTATEAPPAPHGEPWAGAGILDARGAVGSVPMVVQGTPMHDWVHVPGDTPVEARIDGVRCGETVADRSGRTADFVVTVDPGDITEGCGYPGDILEFFIGGKKARETATWGGPTDQLIRTRLRVSSVTDPPGSVIRQDLSPGWNNIAHFEENGSVPAALSYLPSSWRALYTWQPGNSAYLRAFQYAPDFTRNWDEARQFDAFWVYVESAGAATSVNPLSGEPRTIDLEQGWNHFAHTGASEEMSVALEDIEGAYSTVYHYDNETGDWLAFSSEWHTLPSPYNSLGGLLTAETYWIYMTEPATLTLE